ncbi:MAG: trigger factor [Candidatus Kapaibacteriales bacterium]
MEYKSESLSPSKRKLDFTLSAEDLKPHFEKAYNKARKDISLPGFRKGKVPVGVIKKKFGPAIERQAGEDIVNEVFSKHAKEHMLKVIGTPQLTNMEFLEDGTFQFTIQYDTIQDFELSDYKGLTIDEPMHAVTDDEINEEIENILRNQGELEPADKVENEHYVVGLTLREIDKETGEISLEAEPQETNVYLADQNVLPEMREEIIGKGEGETFKFTPDDHTHSHDDDEEHDHEAHEHTTFEITINSVQKLVPRELNEEFVKEYTKDKLDTPDDLKEEIGYQLQENWDKRSRQAMENQIVEKLVNDNPDIEAPESSIYQMIDYLYSDMHRRYGGKPENRPPLSEEMRENLLPMAERSVNWEIIRSKIIEKEDLTVEDHDIDTYAAQEAARTGMDQEKVAKMLATNSQFISSILGKKVIDLILDFAITNETDFEGNPVDQTSYSNTAYSEVDGSDEESDKEPETVEE